MENAARVVEVVAHDPAWPDQFEVERGLLAKSLPAALGIEHIGSTSVPGLAAKPIIDILAVVRDVSEVIADHAALDRLGYVYRPLVFADDGEHLFFCKDTAGRRTHHLHVFGMMSPVPDENRLFRDFIAADTDAARRYEAAKMRAAELNPDSRARYGAAKDDAMAGLMAEARLWGAAMRQAPKPATVA
ncbi:GrpB family protein [Micromonospora sp. NBC_01796]|uniref:GrpB family protein n=1 Tax=Micromonospora sp. NBC_01796 TaxID=2975987 RepID=UPI002DDBE46F|nr:GrpB family protein [Micromonospora sp. NBC_01796]WSA86990.1 GrpB family protein [Micromonospora sp. NBC_01796]